MIENPSSIELWNGTRHPEMLSTAERWRCIERAMLALYRWYVDRSQKTRDWNPDRSFDWRNFRKDHSERVHTILEGFFAVEQFVPDYVTALLRVIRRSYGRSHFHIRWGSEEEKHADLWRNTLLFGGRRSAEWVEEYGENLRGQEWGLPWDDPIHMIFYTVFQERATQVNYLNLGAIARAEGEDFDPELAKMCQTIATDEAAHYMFFLEGARLFLYYFPEESLQAMVNVLRHFAMPAGDLIPDYHHFSEIARDLHIYGPREHSKDVVKVALKQLGAESLRAVEDGIRRSREVPTPDGGRRISSIFDTIDFSMVEQRVVQLYQKVNKYEEEIGLDEVAPTIFIPNPDYKAYLSTIGTDVTAISDR